jgi:DNA-directed RNA polymerase
MKPYIAWSDAVAKWLRAIASKVGKTNQPLEYTTPTGFIIRDAELTTTAEKYATILNGQKSFFTHISPDETSTINTRQLSTRIVANYVHGMDAALCANVIARCEALTIPIATVHDCFSTTPNNAAQLHNVLLEEIKTLHQTSWLPKFKDEVQQRTGLKFPPPPLSKTLDINAIGTCPALFS